MFTSANTATLLTSVRRGRRITPERVDMNSEAVPDFPVGSYRDVEHGRTAIRLLEQELLVAPARDHARIKAAILYHKLYV